MKNKSTPTLYRAEEFDNLHGIHVTVNHVKNAKSHRHDFFEFDYIVEGEGTCTVNGKCGHFSSGDLFFLTPLDFHCYSAQDTVKIITVHFGLDNISAELSALADIGACRIGASEELSHTLCELYCERDAKELAYLVRRNLLERAVILFLREHRYFGKTDMSSEMIDAIGYINSHFAEHIDLELMSEITRYSVSYFCRQFKKYTNMCFIEYLTDVRVRHARNLLRSCDLPMTEIAMECGFGDVRSFYRAFRKKYGCSPLEYKKQNDR